MWRLVFTKYTKGNFMKSLFKQFILFSMMLVTGKAFALDPIYTGFFSNEAIKGYDTVAYFTEGKPVKGKSEFSIKYKGAAWLFASDENLTLFKADPDKYTPQYGGYCAYAVAQGQTASIKPHLFTIYEGKLYLNYNESINDKWSAQKDSFIEEADKNWPTLLAE